MTFAMSLTDDTSHGSLGIGLHGNVGNGGNGGNGGNDGASGSGAPLLDFLAAFNVSTRVPEAPTKAGRSPGGDSDLRRRGFGNPASASDDFDDFDEFSDFDDFDNAAADDRNVDTGTADDRAGVPVATGGLSPKSTGEVPAWRAADRENPRGLEGNKASDGDRWTPDGGGAAPYNFQTATPGGPGAYAARPPASKAKLAAAMAATLAVVAGGLYTFQATRPKVRPTLSGLSAAQILQTSVAAAIRSGSTHIFEADSRGSLSAHAIGDVSVAGGSAETSIGSTSLQMLSANGQLYMLGNDASLRSFGFPSTSAARYSGLWIAVPHTSLPIQAAIQELQLTTLVDGLIDLGGPLGVVKSPAPGEIALIGAIPENTFNNGSGAGDRATLTISTTYPFLPLSLSYGDTRNGSTVDTFSSWGEKVTVTAPPNAQKLQATPATPSLPA